MFSDPIEAYDRVWILGDRFVTQSATVLKDFFRQKTDDNEFVSYLSNNYDIDVYSNDDEGLSKLVLSRLRNTVARGLNDNKLLPKFILLVVEADIIRAVKQEDDVIETYRGCIDWLMKEVHDLIMERKSVLPVRAKRYLYPQIFWIGLPLHKLFKESDNNQRSKFNLCLMQATNAYNEMKCIKMRKKWTFEDENLFDDVKSKYTTTGMATYWGSIDEAVQFWENRRKKKIFTKNPRGEAGFVNKMFEQHKNFSAKQKTEKFGQHRFKSANNWKKQDKYHWNRETQQKMPRPPPAKKLHFD